MPRRRSRQPLGMIDVNSLSSQPQCKNVLSTLRSEYPLDLLEMLVMDHGQPLKDVEVDATEEDHGQPLKDMEVDATEEVQSKQRSREHRRNVHFALGCSDEESAFEMTHVSSSSCVDKSRVNRTIVGKQCLLGKEDLRAVGLGHFIGRAGRHSVKNNSRMVLLSTEPESVLFDLGHGQSVESTTWVDTGCRPVDASPMTAPLAEVEDCRWVFSSATDAVSFYLRLLA